MIVKFKNKLARFAVKSRACKAQVGHHTRPPTVSSSPDPLLYNLDKPSQGHKGPFVLPSLPEFGAGERESGSGSEGARKGVSGLKPGDLSPSSYKVCIQLFTHGITTRRPYIDPFLGS